jgi:hypothetical protein
VKRKETEKLKLEKGTAPGKVDMTKYEAVRKALFELR